MGNDGTKEEPVSYEVLSGIQQALNRQLIVWLRGHYHIPAMKRRG